MQTFTFKKINIAIVVLLICFASELSNSIFAATISAVSNGDWSSTSTWSSGTVPEVSDDVTITGFTVTVSTNVGTIKSLTVESSATLSGKLILQSSGNLTVTTDLTPLILKGGEIENAGNLNLTTTGTTTYCIQYLNTGSGMILTAGKYSGSGVLTLDCTSSTVGAAICFGQTNAVSVFTVGGTYNFAIYQERSIFLVMGSAIIDGTGAITAGTSAAPSTYGLITMAAANAQITINPNVTLNTYTSITTTKKGSIYFGSYSSMTLTNKGVINIQGSGTNGIGAIVTSTINNEGTIRISGAFTESAIGMNVTNSNVLYINNSGSVYISGLPNGVTALATPGTSGYMTFTNNVNGILDVNTGNTGVVTGVRSRLRNYGGTLKGSGIFNGNFEPETGTISPGGDGIGKITIAKLQQLTVNTNYLSGNCILNVNGKTNPGTDFDQIAFTQATINVTNAKLKIIVGSEYTPANNDEVSLITVTTTRSNSFSTVTLPSLNWTINYSITTEVGLKYSSSPATTIPNKNVVVISENTSVSDLIIDSGGTLTLNAGNQLSITNTFSNSGTLNLLSDSDNGTATIITPETIGGSGAIYNVQQYVSSTQTGVNGRNWYISSPLSAAITSSITASTGNGLVYYDGTTNWPDAGSTMDVMKGYIAKSPAQNTTINFTGGTLSTGDKSLINLPLGFNLVGNPYASYVDFDQAIRTNVASTIWYRSKETGTYNFQTYNVTSGISINNGTAMIAPIQSFWIKTESSVNTFGFTNIMRSHQDQSILSNRLKVSKLSQHKLLRLQISNNIASDETVIYSNSNAKNEIDDFDSQKMFNNISNVPELFSEIGETKLVINGMNNIPFNTEIPLGFSAGEAGDYSIKATEFSNFEQGIVVFLKDKKLNTEINLSDGNSYSFSSQPVTANTDRFSIIFRTSNVVSGSMTTKTTNEQVYVNKANQISIIAPEKSNYYIFNITGKQLENGVISSIPKTIYTKLDPGVYVVKVNNITRKAIVN